MTRPLNPRVPQPPGPARPPLLITAVTTPRVALAAVAAVALLSALLAMVFAPLKLDGTERVAAASYHVQMANYAFAPASITVSEGDTITWTNEDTAPHTVTTTSGPQALNSPYLSKGQSWSFTFTVPGTYSYYCTVHPDMRAQVVVRAPAPATTTAPAARQPQNPGPAAVSRGADAHPPARTAASSATTPPSASATTAAAAAPPAAANSTPPPAAQVPAQQTADASGIRTLSPVLLLGGLTAAIAVFCLLLLGSRAAAVPADPASGGEPPDADRA